MARACIRHLDVVVAVLLYLGIAGLYYPGGWSPDSAAQYAEALSGRYDGHHPPTMAVVWRYTDAWIEGSGGWFLVHLLMFCAGVLLCVRGLVRHTAVRPLAVAGVLLFPSVLFQPGMVWKDFALTAAMAMGAGLLLHASQRPYLLWPAAAFGLFAASVRYNGFTALLPLAVWWTIIWTQARGRTHTSYVVVWTVVVGATGLLALTGLNVFLVNQPRPPYSQFVQMYDLAGISIRNQRLLFPEAWVRAGTVTLDGLTRNFHTVYIDSLRDSGAVPTVDGADLELLRHTWIRTVASHPVDYLQVRWGLFRTLVGLRSGYLGENYPPPPLYHPAGPTWSSARRVVNGMFTWAIETWIFRGWPYLLAAATLVAITVRRRPRHVGRLSLSSSAFAYGIGYFFTAPASPFRYFFWTVFVTVLVTVCLVADAVGRAWMYRKRPV